MGESTHTADISAAVTAALAQFDADIASVDEQLESDAQSVTEPYLDPSRGRARVIVEAAQSLEKSIRAFRPQRLNLLEARVELDLTIRQTVLSLELDALGRLFSSVSLPSATENVPALVAATLESLSAPDREAAAADALTALRLAQIPTLLHLAAGLVALQQAAVGRYLDTQPRLSLTSVTGLLAAASVDEVRHAVFEEVVEQLLNTALKSNPVSALVVGVVDVFESVAESIREEQAKFDRDNVDDMCDFADRLKELEQAGEQLLDGLHQAVTALATTVAQP